MLGWLKLHPISVPSISTTEEFSFLITIVERHSSAKPVTAIKCSHRVTLTKDALDFIAEINLKAKFGGKVLHEKIMLFFPNYTLPVVAYRFKFFIATKGVCAVTGHKVSIRPTQVFK